MERKSKARKLPSKAALAQMRRLIFQELAAAGGNARAAKLTPERRSEIAKTANAARLAKARAAKQSTKAKKE